MTRRPLALPLTAAALVAVASGCATAPPAKDLSALMAARPRSILVVPVVNDSMDVTAADYFLSTLPVPLAERGYYVFPVNLVKRLLEDDGLADASMVHGAPPEKLAALFGADAVLYVTIRRWEAKWMLVSTTVTVEATYTLRDGRTGATLWEDQRARQYSSESGNNIIAAVVSAAITKASPNYLPLARQANQVALAYPGPGFPCGPYRPEYGQDYQAAAAAAK